MNGNSKNERLMSPWMIAFVGSVAWGGLKTMLHSLEPFNWVDCTMGLASFVCGVLIIVIAQKKHTKYFNGH